MRRIAIALTAATLLVGAGLSAQAPSFTGKWTLVPDPNAASGRRRQGRRTGGGGLAGSAGTRCTVAQDAKALTVYAHHSGRRNQDGLQPGRLGEQEHPWTFGGKHHLRRSRRRSGTAAKLVITTQDGHGRHHSQVDDEPLARRRRTAGGRRARRPARRRRAGDDDADVQEGLGGRNLLPLGATSGRPGVAFSGTPCAQAPRVKGTGGPE